MDIGLKADRTIVDAEVQHLREPGKWIYTHGEAIFNTTYWVFMSRYESREKNIGVRFTQTNDAFYILMLEWPCSEEVYIDAPIPVLKGHSVTALDAAGEERQLQWEKRTEERTGSTFHIPADVLERDEYC